MPCASYIVSNMSATSVFSSASNVSTGLEMTRSRGSGVSMMGSRAMACRYELAGPPSTHRPSRPERLRQRPFVEIVELPPHRQAVRELGQPHRIAFEPLRSEEHTSELQSLMRISYAVFCLKKKKTTPQYT